MVKISSSWMKEDKDESDVVNHTHIPHIPFLIR